MLQQLSERYDQYIQQAQAVRDEAPLLSGFLGFGSDPRNDPCHKNFFRDVEKWTQQFIASDPEEEQVYAAVKLMLEAPVGKREHDSYWFLFAAQGLCRELIPMLNRQHCQELTEFYDREFPKRDRLDAQAAVYKALVRGAKGK